MRLALATGVALTSPLSSWAQSSPAQGNPIDTLPRVDTSRPPEQKIHVEVQRPNSALENLLATHLTPGKFQIEGVKALPFPEIAAYFAPMAGHDVTVAQLLQAANDVTKLYADRGYPLSFAFVPAQTFEGGVVRITVVEGYVARMRVEGKPGPLEERLRAISKRMMDERPLRRETFERVTGVLALQPGVQITATVQPPTTTDGASELVLDVKRQPYTIGTGVEYRSPGVRAVVTGTLNSLTPLGEQISVRRCSRAAAMTRPITPPRGRSRSAPMACSPSSRGRTIEAGRKTCRSNSSAISRATSPMRSASACR